MFIKKMYDEIILNNLKTHLINLAKKKNIPLSVILQESSHTAQDSSMASIHVHLDTKTIVFYSTTLEVH